MVARLVGLQLAFLAGCAGPDEGERDGFRTLEDSKVTDGDGFATFSIPVKEEAAVLMSFSAVAPNLTYVQTIRTN